MRKLPIILSGIGLMLLTGSAWSQITLGGDHVVTGNLAVGTTGTLGNLTVTGSTGNSASPGLKVTGDGGVVFTGSLGVGSIPMTGDGTRFMWYSKKAAVMGGYSAYGIWDDETYIGAYSVSFGYLTSASGTCSIALGNGASAVGDSSTAIGSSYAAGELSTAMGRGMAYGYSAVAMGIGESDGYLSMTAGAGYAVGAYATSLGFSTFAAGDCSIAFGVGTYAESYNQTVLGQHNIYTGTESATEWVETDRLFVIGNGTGNPSDSPEVENRDAFVVRKNGTVEMNGDVKIAKRQGDVPMGEFGNPE